MKLITIVFKRTLIYMLYNLIMIMTVVT